MNKNNQKQTSCNRCGECCTNGGAALHSDDIALLKENLIPRSDLITLRKGEFAHNPISNRVQPIRSEIVKLRGKEGTWVCCYYDYKTRGCAIYEHRPLACRTLKCWDPAESCDLVERDLLSRFEILEGNETLLEQVRRYEAACPLPDFEELAGEGKSLSEKVLELLEEQANADIRFRNQAVESSSIIYREEVFLFGRPLFQLLQAFGIAVFQSGNGLRLQWKGK